MGILEDAGMKNILISYGFQWSHAYADYYIYVRTKKNVEQFLYSHKIKYTIRKCKDNRYLVVLDTKPNTVWEEVENIYQFSEFDGKHVSVWYKETNRSRVWRTASLSFVWNFERIAYLEALKNEMGWHSWKVIPL